MNELPAAQGAGPGSSAALAPHRARWMDQLTGALLVSAAVMMLVPAVPPALRSLGFGAASTSMQSAGKIGPLLLQERAPLGAGADVSEPDDPDPSEPSHLRFGIPRRGIELLDEPKSSSAQVGEIAAGEPVLIVREQGEWAFIAQNGEDGMIKGWVRRSEIAVR